MNKLLLALAAPLAIGGMPAMAETDFVRGLSMGDAIATCHYLKSQRFNDPNYGPYMLKATVETMSFSDRSRLISLWTESNDHVCVRAVQ